MISQVKGYSLHQPGIFMESTPLLGVRRPVENQHFLWLYIIEAVIDFFLIQVL